MKAKKRMARTFSLFTLVVALALLSACGFHLRGSVTAKMELPPVYLAGAAGPLQRELRHYLALSEATVVAQEKDAQLVIELLGEDIQRRVLSVGSTGKVEEYEVHYAAGYAVRRADGTVLIPHETLDRQREYTYSESEVLAKDAEQARLVQDMRREVVRQMVRRVQAVLGKTP